VLPDSYDAIDPFVGAEFDLPEFHVFDGPTAIVDTVVENVTPETADDVAVIMDSGGSIPPSSNPRSKRLTSPSTAGRDSPTTTRPSARTSDCCGRRTAIRGHASAMFDRSSHLGRPPSVVDDEKFLHELDHGAPSAAGVLSRYRGLHVR